MKLNKMISKNGNLRLTILTLITFIAGLHMIISPESVSYLAIRGMGLIWVSEGISYAIKQLNK